MAFFKEKIDKDTVKEEARSITGKARFRKISGRKVGGKKTKTEPWGKKERLILFVVLLITVGSSGFLAISSRSWKLPGLPRLDPKPALSIVDFFKGETFIIEGDRDLEDGKQSYSEEDFEKAEKVKVEFSEMVENLSGVYAFYVIDLETGFSYGLSEKEVFQAASLIKLPVMLTLYLEAEEGNINLDDQHTLKDSDKVKGAGSLYYKPAGTKKSYRELVELMGKQSDNTAYSIVLRLLSEERVGGVIKKLGMYDTSLEENETTAYDVGQLFKNLWKAKLISEKSSNELLGNLTDTIYESWIAEGVPDDVRVSHKFGREQNVVNDAGIVYSEEPFVLVILSQGVIEREADEVFPDLARIIYQEETKVKTL
jgi:beta-lactamase class A